MTDRFHEDILRIKEDIRYQPIRVLIWGPGSPRTEAGEKSKEYLKREQIKQELSQRFPRAEVYFSEELMDIDLASERPLLQEAVHAKISDLIIILDLGRGAELELDHFVLQYPWFRNKVFLLIKEEYLNTHGLVIEVFKYLPPHQIKGFSEDDFEKCTVASSLAVEATEVACLEYLLTH